MTIPVAALTLLATLEKGPEPEDVKAGWAAFGIFLALAVTIALLGWSLVRHLRKAQAHFEREDENGESTTRSGSEES